MFCACFFGLFRFGHQVLKLKAFKPILRLIPYQYKSRLSRLFLIWTFYVPLAAFVHKSKIHLMPSLWWDGMWWRAITPNALQSYGDTLRQHTLVMVLVGDNHWNLMYYNSIRIIKSGRLEDWREGSHFSEQITRGWLRHLLCNLSIDR